MKKVLIIGSIFTLLFLNFFTGILRAEPSEVVLRTIAMESAGESLEGQAMVARVIIERSRRSGRPLEAICKAPRQFSCWNSPKQAQRWLLRHFDGVTRSRAIEALKMAINAKGGHPTHYHTLDCKPYWAVGHKPFLIVGNHAFYNDIS